MDAMIRAGGEDTSRRPSPPWDLPFLNGGGELGARIRAYDWSRTALGPPDGWPLGLKTAVRIMLTSQQPMWIGWGSELIYLYNDPYKSIVGGKHPNALGQPTRVVWREIWTDIAPLLATALGGDQGTYVEAQRLIMERNGYPEETYYTFSYSPIPNDDFAAGGIICANTDDTERVIRERQLAQLRQLAGAAAEARSVRHACASSGRALASNPFDVPFCLLYVAGADGTTLSLAASAGFPAEHPAAPPLVDLRDRNDWPWTEMLAGTVGLFPVDGVPAELPRGAWDRTPHQVVAVPLAAPGQAMPTALLVLGLNPYRLFDDGYRGFVELVAGHVAAALANGRAYEEERERADALAELDRAKTAFFSNVSHEFRTPLTLMLGPTEEALRAPGQALSGEDLRVVHRNQLRLLKLVNTLLDFSRLEAGRAAARFEPSDIAAITADLASTFRSAVERAGLRLVVEAPPSGEVWIDRDMWEKVVLNLLSNALKHTFSGSITLSVHRGADEVVVAVTDTGTGIAPEHLPHVFERFHRVPSARARTHEGTGIGLALVNEIVKLHKATIAVESAVDRGTTFRIRLRTGNAHLPAAQRAAAGSSPSSPGAATFVEESLRWLPDAGRAAGDGTAPGDADVSAREGRVLVADDNADMREYVTRLLRPYFVVDVASDGEEALECFRRTRPDVVLSDVMMPALDGFGLLAQLRREPGGAQTPIVLLSARAGEEARIAGLQSGADDYLVKPFSARELVATVRAHLRLGAQRRELTMMRRAADAEAQRLDLALDAARLGDWRWDAATDVVTFSPRAAAVFDIPPGPHMTWTEMRGLLHADDRERARIAVETAIREHTDYAIEYRLINGTRERWVSVGGRADYAEDGTVLGMFGVVQEITRDRLLVLVDDAVRRLSDPGEITFTSARLLGQFLNVDRCAYATVEADEDTFELIGNYTNGVPSIVGRYTFSQFGAACLRLMRAGEPYVVTDSEADPRIDDSVGSSYRMTAIRAVICVPIMKAGRFVAAMAVHTAAPRHWTEAEIELVQQVASRCWESLERARVEQERTVLLRAAEAASQAKDEFMAMLGHELRNPLSPILTALQLMQLRGGESHARERSVIERQVKHLTRLVDDLLDVSRIARGKVELKREMIEMAEVVARSIETASPELERRMHTLDVDVPRHGLAVLADPARLSQVISNLLVNAAKYTPPRGRVSIAARRDGNAVELDVRDTGIGIAPDVLPRVFDLFVQGRQALDRAEGGLGLGLTIVRSLVERHGGSVSVHSDGVDRGSRFVVRLPAAEVPAAAAEPDPVAVLGVRKRYDLRILVVDDNVDAAEMLCEALKIHGYGAVVAHDAVTALRVAASGEFDVAFLDIGLPVMDGYELAAKLRQLPRLADLQLIAVTGYGQDSDRRRSAAAGFNHHLVKPIRVDLLPDLLARGPTPRPASDLSDRASG